CALLPLLVVRRIATLLDPTIELMSSQSQARAIPAEVVIDSAPSYENSSSAPGGERAFRPGRVPDRSVASLVLDVRRAESRQRHESSKENGSRSVALL